MGELFVVVGVALLVLNAMIAGMRLAENDSGVWRSVAGIAASIVCVACGVIVIR